MVCEVVFSFFHLLSETLETKIGRNVYLTVTQKAYVFLLYTKETRGPNVSKMTWSIFNLL